MGDYIGNSDSYMNFFVEYNLYTYLLGSIEL